MWVYFLDLYFVQFICVCFYANSISFVDWYTLPYSLKSGSIKPPAFFFLRSALAIWGLLWFHTNYRIVYFFKLSTEEDFRKSIGCFWVVSIFEHQFILPVCMEYLSTYLGLSFLSLISYIFQYISLNSLVKFITGYLFSFM